MNIGKVGGKMEMKKGILKGFDPVEYTATVQLAGSYRTYLENAAVARNLPEAEMVAGRKLAVIFFDEHNAREAVVVAVYT